MCNHVITSVTLSFSVAEVFEKIEETSEEIVIPVVAYVGIVISILIFFLLKSDKALRSNSRFFLQSLFVAQLLHLVVVAIYLKLKRFGYASQISTMYYVAIAMGIFQMLSSWLFYFFLDDCYKVIRFYAKQKDTLPSIWNTRIKLIVLLLLIVVYHVPYVPSIIVLFYKTSAYFTACHLVMDDHWEFVLPKKNETVDVYYIIYFCMMYALFAFIVPYFKICK